VERISMLLWLAGHIHESIETRLVDESLLENRTEFYFEAKGKWGSKNGCYLIEDSTRNKFIRAGMASCGFTKRMKQHLQSSKLQGSASSTRRFYLYYPDKSVPKERTDGIRRANFQDLKQRVGLGMDTMDPLKITNLFEWDRVEEEHLDLLNIPDKDKRNTLPNKKMKHLCYLFEATYAVALAVDDNVTEAPTGEWELKFKPK